MKANEFTDAWFNLCLGEITKEDNGNQHHRIVVARLGNMKTHPQNIIDPNGRFELHHLLDEVIDKCNHYLEGQE
jgi:hypothetical protein